jgi:hypothetical protein
LSITHHLRSGHPPTTGTLLVHIPDADDKTTIKALIKGLTPGPTASHLTRKKPETVEELFQELEDYILSDDDHRKRVAERNEARQGNRDMTWRAPP